MLSLEILSLDAVEIGRNRSLWQPVPRGVALTESRSRTVVVVHRTFGRETAGLFQPSNRFFRADGPYHYDALRYYVFLGEGVRSLQGRGGSLGLTNKPPEAELEPLEFEDQATGEFRSLGSPTAKVPKPPTSPKVPGPSSIPETPSIPKAPSLSETLRFPGIRDLPDPPTLDIPILPEIPGIPQVPDMPVLPLDIELPTDPIPIEYRLLDGKGKAMPPTPFRVTLPDGSFKTGKSDTDGFIRIPDNRQKGQAKLELLDPDESDPERIAAFLSPPPKGKHPIAIRLIDVEDNVLPQRAFRLKLPDGEIKEGKSDAEGFIRFPDNEQTGELELVLTDFAERGA